MFSKSFRVKSNTAIKGSDRRKLRTDVAVAFPALSSEQLSELVPNREELNVVKLYAHKGDAVTVYANNRNPVLFELEKTLYPTVYTLWSYPDLLPAFSTWPPVLQRLAGGADLMLPGVMVPSCGLPQVQQGTLCAITLVGNRAPVAVGVATMSTAEMLAARMKGKGFTVLHAYTDHLWGFGDKSYPPTIAPLVAEPAEMESTDDDDKDEEGREPDSDLCIAPSIQMDIGNLSLQEGDGCARLMEEEEPSETGAAEMAEDIAEVQPETEDGRTPQERMDELLHQCFFHALKCKVKKSELPLLTSTFLRNYMFSCCPEGQQLDIKKSSYKKLSKFLQYMQQQKIIQVKELNKGVESIVHIDWKHSDIKSFVVPEVVSAVSTAPESKCGDGEQLYHAPEIIPLYGVSTKMAPLFQESGHKKGSILSSSDVRNIIISYVKSNELVDETNKNFVKVNPILCDCLLDKWEQDEISKLKWDDLLSRCLEQLQPYHQVTFFGHEPIVRKGNLDPIDITIAQRSSNKKVTIIKNLELYGLDPQLVANTLQQRVQASATINTLPGTKDRVQVQIQGNQINHLAKLLLEEYQLHRKYIQGLEKAPKLSRKK
ncbi:eukaryotic translation initiation factor 2D isoform X2 [Trachemys scripta elegans]|uniref:eukaryotic translation initiation factor 2D isoform X2 n=1 Tax=Trachemys scripta elegans TaxID=31138 RepID=UPI001553E09A|nr:eukaryotic translation initiation factor 2D isoform X2 [Trachemys scripta elegans]XP_034623030.1 eukaryotic translation initiation factor 2D isoform X2 [Trachemys scripta elegans]